jgi:hypothetical protein
VPLLELLESELVDNDETLLLELLDRLELLLLSDDCDVGLEPDDSDDDDESELLDDDDSDDDDDSSSVAMIRKSPLGNETVPPVVKFRTLCAPAMPLQYLMTTACSDRPSGKLQVISTSVAPGVSVISSVGGTVATS